MTTSSQSPSKGEGKGKEGRGKRKGRGETIDEIDWVFPFARLRKKGKGPWFWVLLWH